jgi:hypothetical protein
VLADLLGGIALGDIGLSGLVMLFVLGILAGKLVPKSTLDSAREEAKTWREVASTQQQVNAQHSASLSELLAGQRASLHALQEIQAAGAYALSQRKQGES